VCQAIPRQVLQVDGSRAEVDMDGTRTWVEIVALPDLRAGEYVIVYAGQALETVSEADALETLALYAEMERLLQDAP
jgi:hydrogenase expression/formation protein HypC